MRRYELILIFPLEEDLHKAGRDQTLNDLTKHSVLIEKTDEIGDKDFAYEIKKRKRGRYVLLTIQVDPVYIVPLEHSFKLNVNLLKYFFIRIEG
ncbi:MAG: 30S ribosomal protein S6 [Treponema sp.]|jgi:small subunit ribosomal protein S6|nr:30S ribosomal protein S6 [Treponema sp.]